MLWLWVLGGFAAGIVVGAVGLYLGLLWYFSRPFS